MDYQQTLDYIYSFANFETRPAGQQTPADYTLHRIRALLARLGNPQDQYPTVHIAGTKGKGSTAAMLTSILAAAGYRAGLYTSPHLHTYRERIRVDGRLISEEEVIHWIENHRGLLDTLEGLTTFEVTTAMGFDTFAREVVDIAVIEVGLGGRLDTTNVITPVLSVITPVSLDHTEILGDTITQIAREKAGILKPGVPAVVAPQSAEAMSVIERVAGDLGAELIAVGRDWSYSLTNMNPDGQSIEVRGPNDEILSLRMPLLGAHEAVNATAAIAAAHQLPTPSFPVDAAAIASGVAEVEWPARTELLSRRPWIMVDGAHNGASARCLLDTVDNLLGRRRITLVLGASTDKRINAMLEILLPATHKLVVTRADHPRAAQPAVLQEMARQYGRHADVSQTVAEAVMSSVENAAEDDLILVAGSLFVAAEARMAWFQHVGRPLPPCDPPKSTA
ncbi:MAG: bifunctional folylpolyglutamate synthase/dihydrofolate synthase [Anaerolineae bacterium]